MSYTLGASIVRRRRRPSHADEGWWERACRAREERADQALQKRLAQDLALGTTSADPYDPASIRYALLGTHEGIADDVVRRCTRLGAEFVEERDPAAPARLRRYVRVSRTRTWLRVLAHPALRVVVGLLLVLVCVVLPACLVLLVAHHRVAHSHESAWEILKHVASNVVAEAFSAPSSTT